MFKCVNVILRKVTNVNFCRCVFVQIVLCINDEIRDNSYNDAKTILQENCR